MVEIIRSGMRRVFDEGVSIFIICEDVTSCEFARSGESASCTGSSQVKNFDTEPDEASVEDMLEKIVSGGLGNSR